MKGRCSSAVLECGCLCKVLVEKFRQKLRQEIHHSFHFLARPQPPTQGSRRFQPVGPGPATSSCSARRPAHAGGSPSSPRALQHGCFCNGVNHDTPPIFTVFGSRQGVSFTSGPPSDGLLYTGIAASPLRQRRPRGGVVGCPAHTYIFPDLHDHPTSPHVLVLLSYVTVCM